MVFVPNGEESFTEGFLIILVSFYCRINENITVYYCDHFIWFYTIVLFNFYSPHLSIAIVY